MEILLYIAGVLIMAVAIVASIALHEVGHLVPAKLFGVRVPQYMIGFGKTLFSIRRGETEYGFKAIPLGGYISMIGMYPPAQKKRQEDEPEDTGGQAPEATEAPVKKTRLGSTSIFSSLADAAREVDAERIRPGDENRLFYKLPVYQRIIIMLGGPSMNLLLGVIFTAILVCGFGVPQTTNTVASVSQCVPEVKITKDSINYGKCEESSAPSPAKAAGLRTGDKILAINGAATSSWSSVSSAIRDAGSSPIELKVLRDGSEQNLTITPVTFERPVYNESSGQPMRNEDGSIKTTNGGFVGISPTTEMAPGSLADVPPNVANTLGRIGNAMWSLPQRVWDLALTLVTNGDRDENSPVSIVGVSRIAGEVASTDKIDRTSKAATLVSLIAGLNLMLFAFNLIPLLPLDGGHVLGALWEGVRRFFAKLAHRKDPGPFDPVKLMPLTYVVAGAFILMSLILITADIIKPIKLF